MTDPLRLARLVAARASGATLSAIGAAENPPIGKERVRQLLARAAHDRARMRLSLDAPVAALPWPPGSRAPAALRHAGFLTGADVMRLTETRGIPGLGNRARADTAAMAAQLRRLPQ